MLRCHSSLFFFIQMPINGLIAEVRYGRSTFVIGGLYKRVPGRYFVKKRIMLDFPELFWPIIIFILFRFLSSSPCLEMLR